MKSFFKKEVIRVGDTTNTVWISNGETPWKIQKSALMLRAYSEVISKNKFEFHSVEPSAVWAIVFVCEGQCIYRFRDGSEYRLSPGDILSLNENEMFSILKTSELPLLRRVITLQDTTCATLLCSEAGFEEKTKFHPANFNTLLSTADEIRDLLIGQSARCEIEISGILYRLLISLNAHSRQSHPKTTVDSILFRIVRVPRDKYLLPDLAARCGISVRTFEKAVRRKTGVSFLEFLVKQKMTVAEAFLRENDLLISEIAAMSGYRSAAAFSAVFRTHHGLTPSSYRKKFQKDFLGKENPSPPPEVFRKSGKKKYKSSKKILSARRAEILKIIEKNPSETIHSIAERIGIHPSAVQKHFLFLQAHRLLRRVGPDRGGHWCAVRQN